MLGRFTNIARLLPVLLGMPAAEGPGQLGAPRPVIVRELVPLGPVNNLASAYRLPLAPLPPPPAELAADVGLAPSAEAPVSPPDGCPLEVRAVVVAVPRRESMAVVAVGGESTVLAVGDTMTTPAGVVTLTSIATDHVMVRRGDATVRCALAR